MKISFVTPTYNRAGLVVETLDSILDAIELLPEFEYQLVVIDDASTDDTEKVLIERYSNQIKDGVMIYHHLDCNVGVTGAKNTGVELATGDWVVFIDSDDIIIKSTFVEMMEELKRGREYDVMFFSCVDFNGCRIGEDFESHKVTLEEYIEHGTYGEKLPVIKRDVMALYPYSVRLRGFESLSYFKMLLDNRNVWLSCCVVRKYRTENLDRISGRFNQIKRARLLSEGYFELIKIFRLKSMLVPLNITFKAVTYRVVGLFARLL